MSDIIYTKAAMVSRIFKQMPWELPGAVHDEIKLHLEIMHSRTRPAEWAALYAQTVIAENDYWPNTADIEEETKSFLLAIRKGDVSVKSASPGFYAEAHREYRTQKNRANFTQGERAQAGEAFVTFDGVEAITAQNYGAEWQDCFDTVAGNFGMPYHVQRRRCLRDLLEGIESHLNEHKLAGTKSEFDSFLRQQYREGLQLWNRLTGAEWRILQPRPAGMTSVRRST